MKTKTLVGILLVLIVAALIFLSVQNYRKTAIIEETTEKLSRVEKNLENARFEFVSLKPGFDSRTRYHGFAQELLYLESNFEFNEYGLVFFGNYSIEKVFKMAEVADEINVSYSYESAYYRGIDGYIQYLKGDFGFYIDQTQAQFFWDQACAMYPDDFCPLE